MMREGGVYDPEDLSLLGEIYDRVLGSLPPGMRTAPNAAAHRCLAAALAYLGRSGSEGSRHRPVGN